MPELERKTFFVGNSEVSPDDLGKVEVYNFTTAVDRVLHDNFGWSSSSNMSTILREELA
jgi:hypothetical protein